MILLLACAPAPAPLPPPLPWTLVGRTSSEGATIPTLPDGSALLGPACATVNERLRGNGPPCLIEEWRSDRTLRVERAGKRLQFDGKRGRIAWSQLQNPLPGCLGDPLAIPPAGDPGATRTLEDETWILTFTGANLCHLGGALRLGATQDRADWSDLTASSRAWTNGGLEAAWSDLRSSLRATIQTGWDEMDEAARAAAIQALRQDPDPAAAAILADLGQ